MKLSLYIQHDIFFDKIMQYCIEGAGIIEEVRWGGGGGGGGLRGVVKIVEVAV